VIAGPARALALALVLAAGTARAAGPCSHRQPEAGVTLRTGMGPGDLGVIPEACPATALSADVATALALDVENYYGAVRVSPALRSRIGLPRGPWISIRIPGVDWRLVANASLQPRQVDLGAGSVGAHFPIRAHERLVIGPWARIMMPSETVFSIATRTGWEVGTAFAFDPHPVVELAGGVAFPLFVTFIGAQAELSLAPSALLALNVRPARWVTLAVGAGLRMVARPDAPVEGFDPQAALRFYPWRGLLLELSGAAPVAGRDRTDAAGMFSVGWIFTHARAPELLGAPAAAKPAIQASVPCAAC
jgi:hypothetical protein